jgi:hypothetical protein
MSSKGDPSIGPTVIVGMIGTAVTIVLVTLLHSYYGHAVKGEVARKVLAQPAVAVNQVRAEQLRQINEYRWIDPNAKVVAIPIDRAMELVVAEKRANRAANSPAAAPAGASAEAHPGSPSAPRSR